MKKLTKILGVVLAVVTVASMFVMSVPASAGIHTWTTVATPSGAGFVVSDTAAVEIHDVYQMVYNSDKSVIYATANITDNVATYTGPAIFKSTNSGRTWSRVNISAYHTEILATANDQIFDIVTSPVNVNEVYFTSGTEIYTSKDAGVTWTKLSNLYVWAIANAWANPPVSGTNLIVSLDVAQYGATKLVFVGTAAFGAPDNGNKVAVCTESDFGMPWNDLGVLDQRTDALDPILASFVATTGGNVLDVKVDPTDFATKQGVFAVVEAAGSTYITAKYMGNQWNQPALCRDAEIEQDNATNISGVVHAEIYLPSDFSSNLASGKFQAWVALATTTTQGDVYMWLGGAPEAIDLNIAGANTEREITDIAGSGPIAAPNLVVGGYDAAAAGDIPATVWYSANGYYYLVNLKAPTGDENSVTGFATVTVLPLGDFATSGKALVGTAGYGAAVSYTQDFCKTFNQISLMGNTVVSLDDMGSSVSSVFIVTSSAASVQSVWKQVVIGGTIYWERVYSELPAHANTAPFPPVGVTNWDVEGTADGSVFLADIGGTGIWRSADDGQTWALQFTPPPAPINAWMPLSETSVLVGGTGVVYVTTTNGIVWWTYNCLTATSVITDFDAAGSTWLAVGIDAAADTARVAQSTNGGLTWTTLTVAGSPAPAVITVDAAANNAWVVAAYDFATTGNVFVTTDADDVWRYPVPATVSANSWIVVDNAAYDGDGDVNLGAGMVAGQGGPGSSAEGSGMVYVTDSTAGEGVSRIKGLSTEAEGLEGPAAVSFNGLWLTKSGTDNVLWTLGSDKLIYTYTDTTNKAGSGVAVQGSVYWGVVIYGVDLQLFPGGTGGWVTTVKWNAMPNVSWYGIYVTDVPNDPGSYDLYVADLEILGDMYYTTATTATIGMAPNTKYYISVWASDVGPAAASSLCSSFLFDKAPASYTTAPGIPNWTPNLYPNDGAHDVPVNANLAWDPVVGATGYELQIAKANAADPKVVPSGTATVNLTGAGYSVSGLDYDTTYVWRVRAVTGTSKGEWVTSIFTTVKAPEPIITIEEAPEAPTIILTQQPMVTITQAAPAVTPILTVPQATIVIEQPEEPGTPMYIWIIVAIGALLTIAVVILIIRTRRVV